MMVGLKQKRKQEGLLLFFSLISHQHSLFPTHRRSAAIWTLSSRSFSRGKRCKMPPPPPPLRLPKLLKGKGDGMDAVGDEQGSSKPQNVPE